MKIWCCTLRKWYPVDGNREVRRSCRSDGGHGIESFFWVRHLLGGVCGLPLLFLGSAARRGDRLEFRRKEVKAGRGVLEVVNPEMATANDADEIFMGAENEKEGKDPC